ncbi:MAG TPA: hypothetical protein VFA49_13290 [Chloroflexota bacterium]|jgi:hypothetical protein|nr:hypothetical protein [Chloroflexota bacterium]
MIQEQRCPRCAIRRTVQYGGWGSICFNCRLRWRGDRPVELVTATAFSAAEWRRLEIYRAAVQAGFYTDWPSGSD